MIPNELHITIKKALEQNRECLKEFGIVPKVVNAKK